MRLSFILSVLIALFALLPCAEAGLSRTELEQRFQEANELFSQGLKMAAADKEKAKSLFDECLVRYESILEQGEIQSCELYYNIGNTHYMRGELGYAILNYRRALSFNPSHELTLKNLRVARSKVRSSTQAKTQESALVLLFQWHEKIPQSWRVGLIQGALLFFGLSFCLLHGSLLPRSKARTVQFATAALLLASLCSLILEDQMKAEKSGVVVVESIVGRKGPHDYSYQESFTKPLSGGVEFRFLESREDWVHIQLGDGRQTWVPKYSIEFLNKE